MTFEDVVVIKNEAAAASDVARPKTRFAFNFQGKKRQQIKPDNATTIPRDTNQMPNKSHVSADTAASKHWCSNKHKLSTTETHNHNDKHDCSLHKRHKSAHSTGKTAGSSHDKSQDKQTESLAKHLFSSSSDDDEFPSNVISQKAPKTLIIPINKQQNISQDGIRGTGVAAVPATISLLAEEDDSCYNRVSIDDFGAALLRGMGWNGSHNKTQATDKLVDHIDRNEFAGLGADKAHVKKFESLQSLDDKITVQVASKMKTASDADADAHSDVNVRSKTEFKPIAAQKDTS